MSVVVSDLVARVRAEGVEQTTQQVKAVGDAATQTARALEIMAQAAAKQGGGTPGGWMEIFQKGNVQPTAAAMAQAAQEMQRAAAAAQAAVQPVQNVARAAADHAAAASTGARAVQNVAEGWKLSESSVVRFGAGLAGVSLGISLVAGAARLVHDAIESTVTSQVDWERSLVQVRALYGDIAPRVVALSQAQAALPGVTATQQQLLQANMAAGFLTTRYGVSPALTGTLTTQAARLGGLFYPGDQGQQGALLQAVVDYARTGGGAGVLESATGQAYDPLTLARRLGFSSEAALQALTPQQLAAARGNLETANLAQANIQGSQQGAGLLSAQRDLQHSLEQAQANFQNGLENIRAPQGITGVDGRTELAQQTNFPPLLGGPAYTGTSLINVPPENVQEVAAQQQQARQAERIDAYQKAVDDAKAALDANSQALADNQKQLDNANAALAKFGIEAGSATARLLSFTGSLEDTFSIARGDVAAQAQAGVSARAVGPNPVIARTQSEIMAQAIGQSLQDAWKQYIAPLAQQQQEGDVRRNLQNAADQQGPGLEASRAAAQAALAEIPRRQLAGVLSGNAQQAGAFAQRAQIEAQDQLTSISLRQDERRLAVAQELANLRSAEIQTEQQLTPILLDQANLQDRMVVAARDNLATRREMIQAQQAELRATQITTAYDYEQQRLVLRAEQSRAAVRQGGAPTEDISQLRQEYRALELQRAASGADIEALDASRQTQVVQQQRTAEQLTRDATLTNLEEQLRGYQDIQIPLQQNLRTLQAQTDTIQRTIERLNLEDTAAQTLAQHQLNAASGLALQAAAADRAAQDMAAGMDLGATSAERWAAALEKGANLLQGVAAMQTQQTDVGARIASGLGAGGIGPSPGQPTSPVFHINIPISVNPATQQQTKDQIHQAVEDALNQFFAGAASAGAPAPSTVAGAGR